MPLHHYPWYLGLRLRPCRISCQQNIYFCLIRRLNRQKYHILITFGWVKFFVYHRPADFTFFLLDRFLIPLLWQQVANFLSFHVTQAKFSLSRKGDSLVSQFQHTTCIPYRHRAPLARELHAWPGLCLPQDPPCRCKSWCLGHSQLQNLSRQNLSAQKDFFSKAKLPKLYSSLEHYQSLIQRQILRWCTNFCKSGQQGIQKGPDFRQFVSIRVRRAWSIVVVDKMHAKTAEGGSSSSTKVNPVASAAAISNHSASEFTLNIRLRHI